MKQKITLTSIIAMMTVMPAVAKPPQCENGYHVDNNACTGNTITITWNGATAAADKCK